MSLNKLTSWRAWGFGLIGAVKGAVVTAALTILGTTAVNIDIKWRQFGIMIGMAALVHGFLYIQKSPMPFEVTEETTTTETKVETTTVATSTEAKQNDTPPAS